MKKKCLCAIFSSNHSNRIYAKKEVRVMHTVYLHILPILQRIQNQEDNMGFRKGYLLGV